ncbi:hypothetical protein FBU30_006897, partial [Linnemannia zychae]
MDEKTFSDALESYLFKAFQKPINAIIDTRLKQIAATLPNIVIQSEPCCDHKCGSSAAKSETEKKNVPEDELYKSQHKGGSLSPSLLANPLPSEPSFDHHTLHSQLDYIDTDSIATESDEDVRKDPLLKVEYESSPEYPNGDVVETINLQPNDEALRARSTQWAFLRPQSFKALVYHNCDVAVFPYKGSLIADHNTYEKVVTKKNAAQTEGVDFDEWKVPGYERVDIIEASCMGIYFCAQTDCTTIERPRVPISGKTKYSNPRPPTNPCPVPGHGQLSWSKCEATMVVLHYYTRLKVELHHRGYHDHIKPAPIRSSINGFRAFKDLARSHPTETPGKLMIGSKFYSPAYTLDDAYIHSGRVSNDRKKALHGFTAKEINPWQDIMDAEEKLGKKIFGSMSMSRIHKHITIQTAFMDHTLSLRESCYQTDTDSFPGMTCDFSEGLRTGFELAIREFCRVDDNEEVSLEGLYGLCTVHYKRSIERVKQNGSVIPADKKLEF